MSASTPTPVPFDLPARVRGYLYYAQWVTNLVLGIVSIVMLSLGGQWEWFAIAQAVFNFVWSYVGLTAQNHVPGKTDGA